jgi:hypothetical protein
MRDETLGRLEASALVADFVGAFALAPAGRARL